MIRIFNKQLVAVESGSVYVADIYCDSSDTKPTTELANGSTLTEVDTGKRYLFNEATTSWVEVSGGGGGGSTNKWYRYSGLLNGSVSGQGLPVMLGDWIEVHYGVDWSQHYGDLCDDLQGNRVEMYITTTIQDLTVTVPVLVGEDSRLGGDYYFLWASVCNLSSTSPNTVYAGEIQIKVSQAQGIRVNRYYAIMSGNFIDLTPMMNAIPYTLDIYVHDKPLVPDEEIPYNPPND